MAILAKWRNKMWEVSPLKIMKLEDLNTSFGLDKETNKDADGSPATNVRGRTLQPLSFSTRLSDAVGVNVQAEINSWNSLIGQSGTFYLGGKRFGADKFRLDSVGVSDTKIDDLGRIRSATLNFGFEEDANEAVKDKVSITKKEASKSPGINQPASTDKGLVPVTSSAGDVRVNSASMIAPAPEDKTMKKQIITGLTET